MGPLVFTMTGALRVPGGIATLNLNILLALSKLAVETQSALVVLSYLESADARPPFLADQVRFHGLRGSKLRLLGILLREAWGRPLLIFDHVTLALPVLPLAVLGLARTLIFAHGSESWRRIRWSSCLSFRASALTLANSEFTLRHMKERIGPFRGAACHLGLSPLHRLRSKLQDSRSGELRLAAADGEARSLGPQALLLVGRVNARERQKGHRELIDVLPELQRRHPDVQLVFAGGGDDVEPLRRTARERDVGSSVFVTGYVPVEVLTELYGRCFAFVMPSQQEGFGLSYLEAMNFGKPCVGCANDGAQEIIVDGETGLLVPDRADRNGLLSVLLRLLDDAGEARRMGEAGFRRLRERFTAGHVQERVAQHVRGLL